MTRRSFSKQPSPKTSSPLTSAKRFNIGAWIGGLTKGMPSHGWALLQLELNGLWIFSGLPPLYLPCTCFDETSHCNQHRAAGQQLIDLGKSNTKRSRSHKLCHKTQSRCLILRRRPVLKLWQNSLDYLELSETDKLPGRSDLSWFVTWSQASETSQIVIYWFDSSFTVEHLGNPVDVCFGRLALPVTSQLIHRFIHNFCGNVFGLGVLLNDSRSLGDL